MNQATTLPGRSVPLKVFGTEGLRRAARSVFLAGLALVYFAAGKLGLHFAIVHPSASAIWAPSGVSLAACLLFGSWVWPAIFAGAFLVNVTTAGCAATSLGIALGNTLEALIGAYLVRRFASGVDAFERTQDAFKFTICAVLSAGLSATIGVSALGLGGYAQWSKYVWIWFTWWLGDCGGNLVVAPLLILWIRRPDVQWRGRQPLEAALVFVWLTVTGLLVFGGVLANPHLPIAFLWPPVLLWVAFRFGPRETSAAGFLLALIALIGTANDLGPFALAAPNETLLLVQGFASLTVMMNLLVAIEVAARRRLEESKSRLAAIVDSSSDAIIDKTIEGRIISWNAGATRIFGFDLAEVTGQPITIIVPPEKVNEEEAILARLRRGETIIDLETVRLHKSGRRIDVSLTVSPVRGGNGRIIGVSTIARDIAAQVQSRREREEFLRREQAARQSAQAENRAKDEFLAMLGHELRNPLNAISLAASLLEKSAAPEVVRVQRVIARQAAHVSRMVDDLLDVARVNTGRITLVRRPTDLAERVSQCLAALRETRQLERRELQTNLEPAWVNGDSDRLEQIVANLVSNAVKYTPAGGRIVVSVAARDKEAILRVEDSGAGISADLLPRVFDLFVQGEAVPHRGQGGLGIGLALVKRLVELHEGAVEAVSEGRGRGSTLIVRLPRIAAPVAAQASAPETAAAVQRRILIVENDADARESLRTILELAQHQVFEASDGLSGVAQVAALRPNVALIDLGLPNIDGFEVARQIRALPAGNDVVLIAVTGYGEREYRERAKDAGFNAYLTKPINIDRLVQLISTLSTSASIVLQPKADDPPRTEISRTSAATVRFSR